MRVEGAGETVSVFVSKLEEIMPAEELDFPPTPAFGKYREIMPREAVAHPAKFNTNLVEFLIEKYTRPGDVVLDPMAGSGVLGVVAALKGRNAIQVDVEEKFMAWMEGARANLEKTQTLTPKGWIKNIHGDARRLSELITEADTCIASPLYADTGPSGGDPERRRQRLIAAGHGPRDFLGGRARNAVLKHYREAGEIDAIITSPPYETTVSDDKEGPLAGGSEKRYGRWRKGTARKWSYAQHGEPCKQVSVVITSPPYESSLEGGARHTGGILEREKSPQADTVTRSKLSIKYSDRKTNIGNLSSTDEEYRALEKGIVEEGRETYLPAMLAVYREMWKVLREGGRAIVVVKPLIRKKKPIDLPYYTWLLLDNAGFQLEKVYKLRLRRLSFWRHNYFKKHPDVPKPVHEYVIVVRKP